jgi:hypothetical protein
MNIEIALGAAKPALSTDGTGVPDPLDPVLKFCWLMTNLRAWSRTRPSWQVSRCEP